MPQQTDQAIKDALTAARTNANDLVQWEAELKPILDDMVDSKVNNTALTTALADKANTSHTHAIANVTGLQTALDSKAASTHSHAVSDVTGLQTALDGKQAALVSGSNIKTINGTPVLGSGDITVAAGGNETKQTLTDAATVTWNFAAGKNAQVTLGGNRTLAISNDADQDIALLKVIQDGTGGRQLALPANCRVVNDGAGLVTLSTDPEAEDLLSFYKDGDDFYVNVSRNFTKPTVYDTDAQAYFAAAGITDTTQKDAWNAFVVSAKAKGYWNKFQAIYPFIGGTASAHKWNAKNPLDTDAAFRLTFTGAFTHAANGITGGSGKYANTHYNPSLNASLNDVHLSVWCGTNVNENGTDIGVDAGAPNYDILWIQAYNTYMYASANTVFSDNSFLSGVSNATGLSLVTRNGSGTTQYLSKNGSYVSSAKNSSILPNYKIYIGANNEANTPSFYSTKRIQLASIGTGMSSQNVLDYYTDAAALQTALGR